MSEFPLPPQPSETEIALIDISRTLIDVVVMTGVANAKAIDDILAMHQQRHAQASRVAAAGTIGLLRHLCTSEKTQEHIAALHKLRTSKPGGTA